MMPEGAGEPMTERAFQRVRADSGQGEVAARPRAAGHRTASGVDRPPIAAQPGIGNAALARMLGRARHAPAAVQRSAVHDVLASPGQPLAAPVREEMEARLGADFSDVRVHTDGVARASAAEVGARAYTSGGHVVIGDGGADKHTLAHELTHVVQQRQGPVAGTDHGSGFKVSDPFDVFEKAAEANAARVMRVPLSQHRQAPAGTGEQRVVGNLAVSRLVHGIGNAVVVQRDCNNLTRTMTRIYALINDKKEVFYIGKTYQELEERKKQHDKDPVRAGLEIKLIQEGNWTQFETQTWEQYYINLYASGNYSLDNKVYAITKKKFDECVAANAVNHPNYCRKLANTTWPPRFTD